jgi:hypothetical protein
MSLWTPDGEIPVDRSKSSERPATSASEMLGGPDLDDLTPEERAQAEEMIARMAEVQRQLLSHPASAFVANHLMGLYELAAVHLDQPEPKYEEVRLAIDAMTAMLDFPRVDLNYAKHSRFSRPSMSSASAQLQTDNQSSLPDRLSWKDCADRTTAIRWRALRPRLLRARTRATTCSHERAVSRLLRRKTARSTLHFGETPPSQKASRPNRSEPLANP